MTISDLPAPDELMEQLAASTRAIMAHEAVCPGCQHRLRCPIYKKLVAEEQATLDAACRTLLARTK